MLFAQHAQAGALHGPQVQALDHRREAHRTVQVALRDVQFEAIQQQVTLTLHSPETLNLCRARARSAGRPLRVHLKVETGLGRLGVLPDEVVPFARQAAEGEGRRTVAAARRLRVSTAGFGAVPVLFWLCVLCG